MERSGVRSVIESLAAVATGPAEERMRALLDADRADVRYLVARVSGGHARRIAAVCAAVLAEAGAPTGILDREPLLPGGPLDDALYSRAGRLALSAAQQLGQQRPELGEPSRREVEVALALTAFAEVSLRVVLLVEERPGADAALAVVGSDLTVFGLLADEDVDGALAALPDGRPVVSAAHDAAISGRIESAAAARSLPLLLGGRDFTWEDLPDGTSVTVLGERYGDLPRGDDVDGQALATGIAAALGVGALGVRMRTEWVVAGVQRAARRTIDG